MRILSIDTTSMLGSVALTDGKRLIVQEQQGVIGTHSERLLVTVDHLLKLAKWELSCLEGVAVAIGPGSFTGLRIGIATAKGMALALNIPIVGISSLESLARNGDVFDGVVVPLIDARRGEIYAAVYNASAKDRQKGTRRIVVKECVLPPNELIKQLKKIKGKMLFIGDGALEYGDMIVRAIGARSMVAQSSECYPQAANLAWLAAARFAKGKSDDLAMLVPNYIRESDAEIGFRGRRKLV